MSEETNLRDRIEALLPRAARPSRYIGGEVNATPPEAAEVRMVLAYPDTYEVGASNLGLQILYDIVNSSGWAAAERAFAPWTDMADLMRREGVPLWSLESARPVADFDVIGFTLQYELTFANVLEMLDLAGLPVLSVERTDRFPLVIAGGPCAVNPAPMAGFIDAIVIGDGEEAILEILEVAHRAKQERQTKRGTLEALAGLPGVYVPAVGRGGPVRRRVISELGRAPARPVVPLAELVHDRCSVEIMRGCSRGCRFCQAGIIYRPVRERGAAESVAACRRLLESTGYEEISLSSLSTSDHSRISPMLSELASECEPEAVSISLPSLRTDSFSVSLARQIARGRKTGLTFAPEAGTQRLRDVINKQVTEEDLVQAVSAAAEAGWRKIKLYFMIGLPTETDGDVRAIEAIARRALAAGKEALRVRRGGPDGKGASDPAVRPGGRGGPGITVNVSSFVPKAHTAFQWVGQIPLAEIERRQGLLAGLLRERGLDFKWHDAEASVLEAALARGDRRLGPIILDAWRRGARFDGWSECFSLECWTEAFEEAGVSMDDCAQRTFRADDDLPWDDVDVGVGKDWLWEEYERGLRAALTEDCRTGLCSDCGVCPNYGLDPVYAEARETCAAKVDVGAAPAGEYARTPEPEPTPEPSIIRLTYHKEGRLRWLSHLELMRALDRSIRRSGLPFSITKGFSPRVHLAAGPALPVGVAGEREVLDIWLDRPVEFGKIIDRLNACLPEGLEITEAEERMDRIGKVLSLAHYRVTAPADPIYERLGRSSELQERLHEAAGVFAGGVIDLTDKNGAHKRVQLPQVLSDFSVSLDGDYAIFTFALKLNVPSPKADLLVKDLYRSLGTEIERVDVTRTHLS